MVIESIADFGFSYRTLVVADGEDSRPSRWACFYRNRPGVEVGGRSYLYFDLLESHGSAEIEVRDDFPDDFGGEWKAATAPLRIESGILYLDTVDSDFQGVSIPNGNYEITVMQRRLGEERLKILLVAKLVRDELKG